MAAISASVNSTDPRSRATCQAADRIRSRVVSSATFRSVARHLTRVKHRRLLDTCKADGRDAMIWRSEYDEVPVGGTTLPEMVLQFSARQANRTALVDGTSGASASYAQL